MQPHSQNTRSSDIGIFLVLLVLAVTFRLPWFFQDVISWDESVFILVGDAMAKGHLPYTLVWDNKPPLGFAFFAFVIALVPDSLAFIRFSGAVLVAIAALLAFRISMRLMARHYAFLSATLLVIAVSVLITDSMAVMMEHVALVPMLGALVLIADPVTPRHRLFSIGVLLGAAAMVRTNLAYVLLAVLVLFPLTNRHLRLRERVLRAGLVATGSLVVLGMVALPYALNGYGELLVDSAIRVPLAYSRSGMGYLAAAEELSRQAFRIDDHASVLEPRRLLSTVFWAAGLIGLVMLAVSQKYRSATATFLLVCMLGTLISMLASGFVWAHHLIQLAPFFAVGAGLLASTVFPTQKPRFVILIVAALAVGFTLSRSHFYKGLAETWRNNGEIYAGETFDVAEYLRDVSQPEDTLFVMRDVLLYWLVDAYPPTPVAAFPTNLWEEDAILKPLYGPDMTADAALKEIASRQPTRIILPLAAALDSRHAIPQELLEGYFLENTVSGRLIYRRRPSSSLAPDGMDTTS